MAQVRLTTPVDEASIRQLKAGDEVLISGRIFTGRDAVHKYLADGGALPDGVDLRGGIIYHCGPVVVESEKDGKKTYRITAAGPTTSIREEPYQAALIAKFGMRGVIGKGGMGLKTLGACQSEGAVYLHAVGGAAQVYAECILGVEDVYFKDEFGSPEAIWVLQVKDFPCIVTMDSHGGSLHEEVQASSLNKLKAALATHSG
jgi:tartrate/fumarate subfamily iron-sulfur-dependent hydro-lyase beta chain